MLFFLVRPVQLLKASGGGEHLDHRKVGAGKGVRVERTDVYPAKVLTPNLLRRALQVPAFEYVQRDRIMRIRMIYFCDPTAHFNVDVQFLNNLSFAAGSK